VIWDPEIENTRARGGNLHHHGVIPDTTGWEIVAWTACFPQLRASSRHVGTSTLDVPIEEHD
jgi:hypothetical protein